MSRRFAITPPSPQNKQSHCRRLLLVRRPVLLGLLPVVSAGLLLSVVTTGCGGGGKGSFAPAAAGQEQASLLGEVSLAVNWPARSTAAVTRALPVGTESIVVVIRDSGGYQETRVVNRPAGDGPATVSLSFFGLRTGTLTLTATAFTGANGEGTVLGRGGASQTLGAGTTSNLTLDLAGVISSITAVRFDPQFVFSTVAVGTDQVPVLTVGTPTVTFVADAVDAVGNPVLIGAGSGQWASSNTAVATVDPASGAVTPVGAGDAAITFTETDSNTSASRNIRVTPIRQFALASSTGNRLRIGNPATLTATALDVNGGVIPLPVGAQFQALNPDRATIDQNGVVTTVALGDAAFVYIDPATNRSATFSLTVFEVGVPVIVSPVNPAVILQGATLDLDVTQKDDQGTDIAVQGAWSSSDAGAASVDPATGVVTGIRPGGKAVITFTETPPGNQTPKTASIEVTVRGGDAEVIVN